jgi:hypothetical protein
MLAKQPDRLQLVFSEPVSPVVMNLVGAVGAKPFASTDITWMIAP